MSNSVVKVTDSMLNDSLLLLVGEDGTVTPDKETVDTFLNAQTGVTNIQLMHVNKSDGQSIDVAVENVVYTPDADEVQTLENTEKMDRIAKILYNIRLDHDYTQLVEPPVEEDELAKTLSILDGDGEIPPLISTSAPVVVIQQPQTLEKPEKEYISTTKSSKVIASKPTVTKPNNKRIKTRSKSTSLPKYEQDDDYKDEDFSDENDSDFEVDSKVAKRVKLTKPEVKENKIKSPKVVQVVKPKVENVKVEKLPPLPVQTVQSPATPPEGVKSPDKKPAKKEKKVVKPILDDFALFSTPDIIRRVGGGKEPAGVNETSPSSSEIKLPAKIENRSRSASESSQSSQKQSRLSLDGKVSSTTTTTTTTKTSEHKRLSVESKSKRNSVDSVKKSEASPTPSFATIPNEMSSFDETKPFSLDAADLASSTNLALDGTGLDLDPSLLDNINNDLISDDILYQVAQSLVSNPELQNAIDKSLDEAGNLLDTPIPDVLSADHVQSVQMPDEASASSNQKGTQIIRPDGRIVVIPPIERPTTRSRNKKKEGPSPALKFAHKPLDEEHVSGNELDSSGEDEEESEDDPNKLWCICNQPHNNRFMICCDTCEEWYHGKCVNITKAMGQQMESEGKEWICLFCKDPDLKRPQAAARRIRKASRNSRQSTESAGSSSATKLAEKPSGGTVPCVVCQKASRVNSIFCSESCILAHAQGVERVVVFERATGNMLTGNKAPSASNLEQWLRDHPGYEVVRSAGKLVTTKPNMTQSKLKIVKNADNEGVSLAISKKPGVNLGVLKHLPKMRTPPTSKLTLNKSKSPKVVSLPAKTAKTSSPVTPSVLKAKITQTLSKAQGVASGSTTPSPKSKDAVVVPTKTPKARQAETPLAPQPKQENIRENVQKTIFEQLTNRLKLVEDLKLTEDELKSISTEIESQLYKCFGDTGQKYRNKYRSLIFNIKDVKNQTLWRRICEKSINPYQLVRLSPDDMASQELALWREREAKHQLDMIKKSELELLNCNRQYVLKTHKGEQVLEDNRASDAIDTTEVITSLTEGEVTSGKKEVGEKKSSSSKHSSSSSSSHKEKGSVGKDKHNHRASSKEHSDKNRKRSRSRDRRRRSRSRGRDKHRKSSHKSSRHKKESHRGSSADKLDKKSKEILEQLVDSKIVPPLEDGLWKQGEEVAVAESDSDHEPSSTVTIPTPPRSSEFDEIQDVKQTKSSTVKEEKIETREESDKEEEEEASSCSPLALLPKAEEIWRGIINMIDVAQISITAHEVSGDCNGLGTDLPPSLDIVGRISPDTVWDYIGKMRCSNSKIISLVRLNAINEEEKMPYLALYSYLSSRNRLGVVKSTNKAVKDFYIWPLAAHKPIPQALLPISGPGFEEARPALLLGIIVRDKRKRSGNGSESSLAAKKSKLEVPSPPARSYTPPPTKDLRSKLPLPPAVADPDEDEPYSPEDSDPEGAPPTLPPSLASSTFQPFSNKFDDVIPGLETPSLPSTTQEIQRQMEKLNKEIEMQKSEIDSISQNIATASTEIGTSALASIALPSNLQQILDSIKTIGAVADVNSGSAAAVQEDTIPLMLPTSFSRNSGETADTIPLNIPSGRKVEEKASVLSSLSEEDLIRKAEEMLGQSEKSESLRKSGSGSSNASQYVYIPGSKSIVEMPPIPGLEDEPFQS